MMLPTPQLTVLFATHNGEDVLPRTLKGYCELEPPPIAWQLIVVDNGSYDATASILHDFSKRLPLQVLRQSEAGKNRALNLGLQVSDGRLVVLTDNDAVPLPSFLRSWADYIDTRTDYELLGGTVVPMFESPAPSWVLRDTELAVMLFAIRELPEGPVRADEIFGANMAIRKSVIDRGFRLNEDMGPNAADPRYPMGGESEFCRRLERAGVASWFAQDPAVRHIVRAHHFTDRYLADRAYRLGRGWFCQQWNDGKLQPGLAPRPVMEEGAGRLLRRLRMLSPFALQRRQAIYSHCCELGFRDEHKRRIASMGDGVAEDSGDRGPDCSPGRAMKSIEPSSHEQSQTASAVSLIAVGVVVFNNSTAQLADLGCSLLRASDRLASDNARPAAEVGSVFLLNNGNLPVDPTAFGPHARLKSSQTNLGFGRAHDLLMAEAFAEGADFYLALNPDGMLHPDAIVEMTALARRCGGRALVEAAQFPEELPKVFDPLTLDTPWASGCCLLIPAVIYEAIGGFDENLFLFCEDVDLSWRARESGYAVKHAPRALFHHRFNRIGNEVSERAHLDAARYLAARWGGEALVNEVEQEMAGRGWEPRPLPTPMPSPCVSSVPDLRHGISFAPLRWQCPGPIPMHRVSQHADLDNTIDVIVRFHDPAQIGRLSRCLFSLYGQQHQPIQVLLMLQGLDDAGVAAVEASVDAFDWATPRRRPVVTNVAVPPTGDHRSRLWNAGLDVGRARYLGICDFDDICYAAGYSYLLHRLQYSGAAAAFASSFVVDCTPMDGFDFAFAKCFLEGEDRYDFFVAGFCPPNCVLIDRSRIAPSDLRADETLSKQEDYRVLVMIAAKYQTDWKSIGTAVAEYYNRTDGTNTVLSHRNDAAGHREWDEVLEAGRKYLGTLTTEVPVTDIMRMRSTERRLQQELAQREAELARVLGSRTIRMTRPIRAVANWIRQMRK